jgi:hypothetical protein
MLSCRAKDHFRIGATREEPRDSSGLVAPDGNIAARVVRVSLDLRVYGVAQAEPLVPQLRDVFRIVTLIGPVNRAHSFQQTERDLRVDGCDSHGWGRSEERRGNVNDEGMPCQWWGARPLSGVMLLVTPLALRPVRCS